MSLSSRLSHASPGPARGRRQTQYRVSRSLRPVVAGPGRGLIGSQPQGIGTKSAWRPARSLKNERLSLARFLNRSCPGRSGALPGISFRCTTHEPRGVASHGQDRPFAATLGGCGGWSPDEGTGRAVGDT